VADRRLRAIHEWLWAEKEGTQTAPAAFDEIYARPASNTFWPTAQAAVSGPEDLFSAPVYERGPMAWLYTPGKPAL
jgi:hypothetical protein